MASLVKSSVVARAAPVRANKMLVWQPTNNKFFETFSYLPPLSDAEIARQVEYVVSNGWTPCLEFSEAELAYTANTNTVRMGPVTACYQDNRYWTMWKLPMFGCQDPSQVLGEVRKCQQSFPDAYIRMVAFDSVRQVQMVSFLVQRPKNAKDWCPVEQRSVGGAAGRSSAPSSGRSAAPPAPKKPSYTYSW